MIRYCRVCDEPLDDDEDLVHDECHDDDDLDEDDLSAEVFDEDDEVDDDWYEDKDDPDGTDLWCDGDGGSE